MSRRDLIRMTDDEVEEFLNGRNVMNIATFGPDGNIHLVAMWYGFLNGNMAIETFAKSQKVRNVERDPRVTVLIEDGDVYEELRGVEIVGKAVIHADREPLMEVARNVVERYIPVNDPADIPAVAEAMANKRVAIEIVPDKIVSWDHRKLGGTY
ncbi:MAG: pyridoxamine 5'-phosphate oxidase family protein [Acidimicrobiales bacterium]